MKDELESAVAAIRDRADVAPAVGVVLGSGLGSFADALEDAVEIPYADIPGWPVATALGHAGTLVADHLNLQGRSPLVGPNDDDLGPRFPDLTDAYDPDLRAAARAAADRIGL